ncbi:MAG: hypothetical protein LIO42_01650 [Oscillospiraceae bacterium]|nr:hypothetical protein [Oscillospiraceae bacterium]
MRKLAAFLWALCLLLFCAAPSLAAGVSGSTVITTEVPSTHTLTVEAENATVSYGGREGMSFQVPRNQGFSLDIQATEGHLISQILLDGEDVTASFSRGTLTLSGIHDAAALTVTAVDISDILYELPEQELPDEDVIYAVAIEVSGLTAVPEALQGIPELNTVEKIEAAIRQVLVEHSGYPAENVAVYEVTLVISIDGGTTWEKATEENFPADGLLINLPYPEGTGPDTHDFAVTHMFTSTAFGKTPGDTENPAVTKTDEGIQVTVTGLSPIGNAWTDLAAQPGTGPTSPATGGGDTGGLPLWAALLAASSGALALALFCGRKKKKETSD